MKTPFSNQASVEYVFTVVVVAIVVSFVLFLFKDDLNQLVESLKTLLAAFGQNS